MEFESHETVTGRVRGSDEWIEYEAILRVKDSEKKPVSLELKWGFLHNPSRSKPFAARASYVVWEMTHPRFPGHFYVYLVWTPTTKKTRPSA